MSGIDLGALVQRLILFDEVVIKSVRLRELPFLVRSFGKSGIVTALRSGIIRLSCEFTSVIEDIALNGVRTLPLDQFSFGISELANRESDLNKELLSLQSVSGLKNRERSLIEDAVWEALVRPEPSFGQNLQLQVEQDIRSNTPALRASIIHALKAQGLIDDLRLARLQIAVEEVQPKIFKIKNNIVETFGMSNDEGHRILARAVHGVIGLDCRLADMAAYSAITGLQDDETDLLFAKFAGLMHAINPSENERRFERVLNIAGLGQPLPSTKLNIDKLLEIRDSEESREFRKWLDYSDSLTGKELESLLCGIRSKASQVLTSHEGRMLRFAATFGIGLIPGALVPAAILGFADAFLVEKLFPKSGVVTFLKQQYPSIYEES